MSVVEEIKCSHCGAPIEFRPGEILATCKYCGYTVVVETGKTFDFEHSLLLNRFDQTQIEEPVRNWMREGFLKPQDLAKKAKITEKTLVYLPFWVVSVEAKSSYKGIFERISPAVVKEGTIEKDYDWLVLARKATDFPTKDYNVPLEGKVPYDFRRIEGFAEALNSEIDKDEAVQLAKEQIEALHRFLSQQDIDKIIDMKTDFKVEEAVYLHAPVWFVKYLYKGETYQLLADGVTGGVIKGSIPATGFGIL
jgi:DNA-directed RNA polymerase subunit RPC12/RpoP